LLDGVKRHIKQYFSYTVAISFIGGGNRIYPGKLPTCRMALTSFITLCCIEYTSPWTGFESPMLVVLAKIVQVVVNPTTMRSRSRWPPPGFIYTMTTSA